MNHKQKTLIDRLEASGKDFAQYLAQLSDAELFASSAPTDWTIHQAAAHMRDTEQCVFLARVERIMREPHPAVQNFDQGEHWKRIRIPRMSRSKKSLPIFARRGAS